MPSTTYPSFNSPWTGRRPTYSYARKGVATGYSTLHAGLLRRRARRHTVTGQNRSSAQLAAALKTRCPPAASLITSEFKL